MLILGSTLQCILVIISNSLMKCIIVQCLQHSCSSQVEQHGALFFFLELAHH